MIKIIFGKRRCGKSYLLKTVIEELKENGINNVNIVDFIYNNEDLK